MAIVTLEELPRSLKPDARLLGLDLGAKTIGMAVSDPGLSVASPIGAIRRGRFGKDAGVLIEMIGGRSVGGLVMGLPVNMDGAEGPRCQSTRQFAANLLEKIDIPIAFWDERLSTAAVERLLVDEADMTRKHRGDVVDKMAAAYILQGALDAMKGMR